MAMYQRISEDILPPHLKDSMTIDNLNECIKQAFSQSIITKDITKETNYTAINNKIYLDSSRIDTIKKVTLFNKKGTDIKYTANLNTQQYCNYIEINRPLEPGETLRIEYTISPGGLDLLYKGNPTVYIKNDIYETLIDILYEKIKSQQGVKKDGKN